MREREKTGEKDRHEAKRRARHRKKKIKKMKDQKKAT
jgi:hypothetical protein